MPAPAWLAVLDGLSPWWWVAIALGLAIAEALTGTTFLLGPTLAALSMALWLVVAPDLSGTAQIAGFALAVLVWGVIAWAATGWMRRLGLERETGLNRRAHALVGREARTETAFEAGIGRVVIDGVPWRARLDGTGQNPDPGETVRISGVDGATLVIRPPMRSQVRPEGADGPDTVRHRAGG